MQIHRDIVPFVFATHGGSSLGATVADNTDVCQLVMEKGLYETFHAMFVPSPMQNRTGLHCCYWYRYRCVWCCWLIGPGSRIAALRHLCFSWYPMCCRT